MTMRNGSFRSWNGNSRIKIRRWFFKYFYRFISSFRKQVDIPIESLVIILTREELKFLECKGRFMRRFKLGMELNSLLPSAKTFQVKNTFKKFIRAVVPVFWGPKIIKSGKFLHLSRRAAGNISRCRLSSHGLVHIGDFASIGFCWKYFCAISDGVVWTSRKLVHFETKRNKWPKV